MVFLGTVTQVIATKGKWVTRARMRIDRAYKGVSERTLVLFDDGMCNGPNLEVGEQYLMYTGRFDDGDVPSRGCTRSRHVKYADEDLKYLNSLGEAAPAGTVFGKVAVRTDDYNGDDQAKAGAAVELKGPTAQYTTTADGEGLYSFASVEPATYDVTASQDGFRMLSFEQNRKPPSASVAAGGCAAVNLLLRRKWRGAVTGQVVRSGGTPAPPGMPLTLIRVEDREGETRSRFLFGPDVSTNEKGEYSFEEVAPGRYKIVMNWHRFPTVSAPYPAIYWPAARSESEAITLQVADAPSAQRYNFKLPPEPRGAVVSGIVLYPDGKAAPAANLHIEALPDKGMMHDDDYAPATEADGRFSFTAFEGFDYRLSASAGWEFDSNKVDFSLAKGPPSITLVLEHSRSFPDVPADSTSEDSNP